jgi:hypothetical protein
MTTPNKTELKLALAENALQIQAAVGALAQRLNNEEWQSALNEIFALRKAQAELEGKLKALADQAGD